MPIRRPIAACLTALLMVMVLMSQIARAQEPLVCGSTIPIQISAEISRLRHPLLIEADRAIRLLLTGEGSLSGVELRLLDSADILQQIAISRDGDAIALDVDSGRSGAFTIEITSSGAYRGPYALEILCDGADGLGLAAATVIPESATVDLQLFTSRGTLTLYVPESVSLTGLTLVAVDQRPFAFTARFDSLQLTGGLAPADSCYILRSPEGATEPIPDVCRAAAGAGRIALANISAADNFWYDSLTNQARAIGVRVGDTPLTNAAASPVICPGGQPTCTFAWAALTISATPTPVMVVATPLPIVVTATQMPTLPTSGYPCSAEIVFTTGALLNQVRVTPARNAPPRPPVQQGATVTILQQSRFNEGLRWYEISYVTDREITGWIPSEYLTPGNACPIE
jgi:hypothetical protein